MVGTDKLFQHFYYIQDMDFQEFKTQLHIYTGTCGAINHPKFMHTQTISFLHGSYQTMHITIDS